MVYVVARSGNAVRWNKPNYPLEKIKDMGQYAGFPLIKSGN
jgi:hypothetical protein